MLPLRREGLGEHLRRQGAQRESGVDDLGRQILRSGRAALDDHVETDLLGVGDPVGELRKRLSVVQIRGVYHVAGCPQLVGESEESLGLPLCMMEEEYLGHGRHSNCTRISQTRLSPGFRDLWLERLPEDGRVARPPVWIEGVAGDHTDPRPPESRVQTLGVAAGHRVQHDQRLVLRQRL